jgi:hypothetical protein
VYYLGAFYLTWACLLPAPTGAQANIGSDGTETEGTAATARPHSPNGFETDQWHCEWIFRCALSAST